MQKHGFHIANRLVGAGRPCLIIGEVAQAHDGSLGIAHAFIDAIAGAGADAVKYQTHIAAAESTIHEPWRTKFSYQDETRYDYWKRVEFTPEQWHGLKEHAEDAGLIFLSSPFSPEAVDLLEKMGIQAWKVASGEITNAPMLKALAATGKPLLISTGMSPVSEIDGAVELVRTNGAPYGIFQCSSAYPCPPEKVGLNMIPFFADRYGCPVGLSDHSGLIYPSLGAAVLGANMIEVHVTLSREMFGPDVPASVTTEELAQLVDGIRFLEKTMAHPVDKDAFARDASDLRSLFTKSIVMTHDLTAGAVLTPKDLTGKKPGTGLSASRLDEFIGKRLIRDKKMDEFLSENDVE